MSTSDTATRQRQAPKPVPPKPATAPAVRKARKEASLPMLIMRWYHPHICALVVAGVLFAAQVPGFWQPAARSALRLSYAVEKDGNTLYGTGWDDVPFIVFHVFSLTLLRALASALLFGPLGRAAGVPPAESHKFKVCGRSPPPLPFAQLTPHVSALRPPRPPRRMLGHLRTT